MSNKLSSANKILAEIAEQSNDTGESIGNLLRNEKTLLEETKNTNKNIKEIADSNRRMAHAAEEERRESKKAGGAGSIGTTGFGAQMKESMKEAMKGVAPIYANATNPLKTMMTELLKKSSLGGGSGGLFGMGGSNAGILGTAVAGSAGFLIGFLTPVINSYKTLFMSFYDLISPILKGIGSLGKSIFTFFMETFPLADELKGLSKGLVDTFKILSDMLMSGVKFIGNGIDYGLILLRRTFGMNIPRLETILNFFGDIFTGFSSKIGSFLSADGILYGTMNAIQKIFGEGALNVFVKAFEFGEKLAKFLPFLTVIPTAIETIVAAFEKFETEGFKGVFKAIMVGLLKGVVAFFTLGLSDFALDFEKMYATLSNSLDGLFEQFSAGFDLVVDVFESLFATVMQLWDGVLKPIFTSLYEDALKPIMETLSMIGDFAMILFDMVVTILNPVIAIARFAFKVIFEVVKVVWNFLIYPIIELLVPVFKFLFKTIGILMIPIQAIVGALVVMVGNFWEKFLKPILNWITDLFSAGAEMGSLSDMISEALAYWGDIIKAGWNFIIGYYEMITDTIADAMLWWYDLIVETWDAIYNIWDKTTTMIADAMLWWADLITEAWNYIYGLWDTTTSLLADGMLIWAGWIQDAWNYIYGLWDTTTSLLADGMLIWAGWIQDAWNYIYGLWDSLTDALAYGILWWHEKITDAWNYVVSLWEFAVDALAESLEPIVSPIMDFFDYVGQVFNGLKEYASSLVSWIPGLGGGGEAKASEIKEATPGEVGPIRAAALRMKAQEESRQFVGTSAGGEVLTSKKKSRREEDEESRRRLQDIIAREEAQYGKEGAAALRDAARQQMAAGGGAAGGAGISSVVINNAPTTNIAAGGGGQAAAIPVPLSPNPIRHADPTRAMISY
jgi:phage-related protein